MKASELFALPDSLATFRSSFSGDEVAWDWLKRIAPALAALKSGGHADIPPGVHLEGQVYLDPTVKLPPHAVIIGPAWIGPGTEIRPGAYLRGNVIVGANAVLGNSCEFKNCLLLDGVQAPHFSYVGDSILGNRSHLGAGVILSNLRLDQQAVTVRLPGGTFETGLRKFGALLGDQAEVGCNAVLQPGTILGKRALVMPTLAFGGYLEPGMIARTRTHIATLARRD